MSVHSMGSEQAHPGSLFRDARMNDNIEKMCRIAEQRAAHQRRIEAAAREQRRQVDRIIAARQRP